MSSPLARAQKSCGNWKQKAVDRGAATRYLRRSNTRLRVNLADSRQKGAKLQKEVGALRRENASLAEERARRGCMPSALQASHIAPSSNVVDLGCYARMRPLCVMLATAGVLSFRSIPRVLRIFMKANWIPSSRVPHFTSIINWTVRAGISVYRSVSVVREGADLVFT